MRRLSFFLWGMLIAYMSAANPRDTVQNKLTAVRIIKGNRPGYIQLTFFESQRFYKLLKTSGEYRAYLNLLQWSVKHHKPVWIKRTSEYSDTIISVKKIVTKK